MVSVSDQETVHRERRLYARELSAEEREKLVKAHLPDVPVLEPFSSHRNGVKSRSARKQRPIRSFLKSKLHVLAYSVIHLIFGIYIRLRQTYYAVVDRILALFYYHHRTPELIQKDVKNLSRLPEHLSVILTSKSEEDGGLEALIEDVAELGAWCASAGIPLLSIYEKNGVLVPTAKPL